MDTMISAGNGAAPGANGTGALIKNSDTKGFMADVIEASRTVPVIVDFWAPWCGPCRTQGPIVEQVASQMGDRAVVAKVNVDDERGLAAQFAIQAIPTLVVLKDGNVVQRFVGVQRAEALAGALESAR
jgi:thioredoxin